MSTPKLIRNTESIGNPLVLTGLSVKSLGDYVVNPATGCSFGCTFCYVPSTPGIRFRESHIREYGVADPQLQWGQYLIVRENLPQQLRKQVSNKKKWKHSEAGQGVIFMSSTTDPFQNREICKITAEAIEILLEHGRRIRILTRSPLWLNYLSLLKHPDITVGMSLPYVNDELARQIEPNAPPTSDRYKALLKGSEAGVRTYVAIAPTPPMLSYSDFLKHFQLLSAFPFEIAFWEAINPRGENGQRMLNAGLSFVQEIRSQKAWASYFLRQWDEMEQAAADADCLDRLHIWPDKGLAKYTNPARLQHWWHRPTVEQWSNL